VPIVPQVVTNPNGGIDVGVASDGTVVYAPGIATVAQRAPVWVDRQGQETPLPIPPRAWDQPRISPDGAYVVLHGQYDTADLWLWDVARAMLTRLTFDPLNDLYPAWMPDSRRLVFSSERSGQRNLFAQSTDGTGAVDQLVESPNQQSATSVSPDGSRLVFTENAPKSPTGNDVMQLRLDGSREIVPLVQTAFIERNAEVSPDGRWLAYEANDTGVFEIYVRPFPAVAGGRWQVSGGGGRQPLWARNGAELFYLDPAGALLRVGVEKSAGWIGTAPQKVLEPGYYTGTAASVARNHDITPDGRRFLVIKPLAATQNSPSIVVVQHWGEELKQLVTPQ
jgi:dipeptidyl aminopeptidase/acylaminoacyl peptidase